MLPVYAVYARSQSVLGSTWLRSNAWPMQSRWSPQNPLWPVGFWNRQRSNTTYFLASQDETEQWGQVSHCSFLEVVLVARDSCSKKSSGISRKPLALTEGSCTLHVSPCPLASELEETILGSICWTRCSTLLPNPDTMTCWDGGCIRLICVGFSSSYDFPLEIFRKWLYTLSDTQCMFFSFFSILMFTF